MLRNWVDFRRFRLERLNPFLTRYPGRADIIHCHPTHDDVELALVNITQWYSGHLHISEFSGTNSATANYPARVVLSGVDPERFSPDETVARSGAVLYVGRRLPHNGS